MLLLVGTALPRLSGVKRARNSEYGTPVSELCACVCEFVCICMCV